MRNKSLTKLARKDLPYKSIIPPAHEVNLCLELACSHVLWGVLPLNKSALSLSAINSVCLVQFFVCDHQEPGYLCPPVTLGLVRILQKEVKAPKRSLDLLKWCLQEYSLSLLVSMAA